MDVIDRVEIVRGPGSAIYGANAYLGVVNIITKKGSDFNGALLGYRGGSLDTTDGTAVAGYGKGKWDLLLSGSGLNQDRSGLTATSANPQRENAKYQDATLRSQNDFHRPRTFYQKLRVGGLSLSGYYSTYRKAVEFSDFTTLTHMSSLDQTLWRARGAYEARPSDRLKLNLTAAYGKDSVDPNEHIVDAAKLSYWVRRDVGAKVFSSAAEGLYTINDRHNLVFGADYQREDHKLQDIWLNFKATGEKRINGAGLGDKSLSNWGAYLSTNLRFDEVRVNLAGRLDSHSTYHTVFNPQVGVVWQYSDRNYLKALAASSFKAPTSRQLFDTYGSTRGNLDLKPQRVWTSQLLWGLHPSANTEILSNVFYNHITDVISFAPNTAVPNTLVYINAGEKNTLGFETEGKVKVGGFEGYATFSYQRTKNDEGERAPFAPSTTAGLGLSYLVASLLDASLEVQYVGEELAPKSYDAGFKQSSHTLVNLNLQSRDLKIGGKTTVAVFVNVRNLLNEKFYEPGFTSAKTWNQDMDTPQFGRTAFAGIRIVLGGPRGASE